MNKTTHELKTLPEFFNAVWRGRKTAEVRKDDRGFVVDDTLVLREWDPAIIVQRETGPCSYTGRAVEAIVTHVLRDFAGLAPGYVMLSFRGRECMDCYPEER